MADLFETLGALRGLTTSAEHSAAILKLALDYGPTHPERAQARLKHMLQLTARPHKSTVFWAALGSTVALAFLLVLLSKRRRR
jgi:hypothetical protein